MRNDKGNINDYFVKFMGDFLLTKYNLLLYNRPRGDMYCVK